MRIDANGRVGIGGQPSRSAREIAEEAKSTLDSWKSDIDDRLKAEPKADKKAVTLEITGEETLPTLKALEERLQERNIGGGSAKLQVASKVAAYGIFWPGHAGVNFTNQKGSGMWPAGPDGGTNDGVMSLGADTYRFKDGHFSGNVYAGALVRPIADMCGITFNNHNDGPEWLPTDPNGARTDGQVNIGRRGVYRIKNIFCSGTIYGTVDDVPSHVKAITPTQIANWDAGTGGGGGGANIDGRISDTQIIHWDQAYNWGNHATAGYQPAGSYADASHTHSQYVPTSGNTTISGTLTATDFIAQSDERLKKNVETADPSVVSQLRGVTFDWVDSGKASSGVIAQEVEKVLPHLVHDDGDSKAVNYNGLVAYLIEEVKSLRAELEAMK
jgi:hypothetical protein